MQTWLILAYYLRPTSTAVQHIGCFVLCLFALPHLKLCPCEGTPSCSSSLHNDIISSSYSSSSFSWLHTVLPLAVSSAQQQPLVSRRSHTVAFIGFFLLSAVKSVLTHTAVCGWYRGGRMWMELPCSCVQPATCPGWTPASSWLLMQRWTQVSLELL